MASNQKISDEFIQDLTTVIVPVFNREAILAESLNSVYEQTYRPIELIIVDDGSTDKTVEVAKDWIENTNDVNGDLIVKLICKKKNAGPSAARNEGLGHAHGEYIQFLDSDDILHSSKISAQVEKLKASCADFCVSDFQKFSGSLAKSDPVIRFSTRSHSLDDFPAAYPMNTPTALYRRVALSEAGLWDEDLKAGEDFEYNFRLMCTGARGIWVGNSLVFVRAHEGNERIQSMPLKMRYGSMYLGLVKMELQSMKSGLYTKALRKSLALRALSYVSHMKKEGNQSEAMVFNCYAKGRLTWINKITYFLKKNIYDPICNRIFPGGYTAMKKRFLGSKV